MQVLTKSQLISQLAERVGVQKRQVALVLESLVALAITQCQTVGSFVIPGFGKV
jgi:nucleoid DNA-binding protein